MARNTPKKLRAKAAKKAVIAKKRPAAKAAKTASKSR